MDFPSEQPQSVEAPAPQSGQDCTPSDKVSVLASASPDFNPGTPGVAHVITGTPMQLTGSCQEVQVHADCSVIDQDLPFTWSLTFQPPAGNETDATSILADATTLTPTFIARDEGIYRARLTGGTRLLGMETALVEIDVAPSPPPPELLEQTGTITFLRVHDLDSGFGPPDDFLDVEAVIKLDTAPDDAFGFQLRNDRFRPSHQGMLDLLRDAFFHNHSVTIDYLIVPGRHNGVILRVALAA